MIEAATCQSCKFWEGEYLHHLMGIEEGACHRYPRTTMTVPGFWCGEYERKEESGG